MPSLYVHIPFCLSKCYYCDFVSATYEPKLAARYVEALCREARFRADELRSLPGGSAEWLQAPTVFFGGGTPSTLSVDQLTRILGTLRSEYGWKSSTEITLEANPRTHVFQTAGALTALRDAGINRLSIGAQTFDDNLLQLIGRDHGAAEVEKAVTRARDEGFDNLSMDLIFALPGQTLAGWSRTVDHALGLGTEHISLYNLTIEEGTVFGEWLRRGELVPTPSDLEAEMYALAIEKMSAAGLEQYEVSNFARPGRRSEHNQVYWRREDYLGLGVGAHSCIRNSRFANGRNTLLHVRKVEEGHDPTESRQNVLPGEALGEAMWLGLRLLDGVSLDQLANAYGIDPGQTYGDAIANLRSRGLLLQQGDRLALTREGLFLGNEVFCHFV